MARSKLPSLKSLATAAQRFWSKVDRRGDDECWPWTDSVTDNGYGQFRFMGKIIKAHRLAWAIAKNGGNLPGRNVHIHHSCESRYENPVMARRCCNPAHLYAIEKPIHDAMHQKERRSR